MAKGLGMLNQSDYLKMYRKGYMMYRRNFRVQRKNKA